MVMIHEAASSLSFLHVLVKSVSRGKNWKLTRTSVGVIPSY